MFIFLNLEFKSQAQNLSLVCYFTIFTASSCILFKSISL